MSSTVLTPVPTLLVFSPLCGQFLEWGPIVDGVSNAYPPLVYLDAATGTLTIKDPAGVPVPGASALSFAYVNGSTGLYRALIPATFNPPLGSGYTSVIDFQVTGYQPRHWEVPTWIRTSKGQQL
jgi:hypothetical protein